MRTVMHIGSVAIAAVFALALVIDAADARRGGGGGGGGMRGGGMRAGGMGGGGRVGMAGGGGRAHVSNPIARPGGGIRPGGGNWANRPGGGGNWANRPGWNNPGYRPGWGAAAAAGAIGAGIAYGSGYYGGGYGGYYEEPAYTYPSYGYETAPSYSYETAAAPAADGDLIAECARRFKTYDMASQTYIKSKGVRASCP